MMMMIKIRTHGARGLSVLRQLGTSLTLHYSFQCGKVKVNVDLYSASS